QPGGRPKLRADVNLLGLRAASQAGGMATMNQALEHVTIVGGGTAGWLTAMMLNTYLNGRGKKQNVNITLIESPNVPTIGVGEATIITLPKTMRDMDVNEAQLIYRT